MSVAAHQTELQKQVNQYKEDAENVCTCVLYYSNKSHALLGTSLPNGRDHVFARGHLSQR